MTCGMFVDMYSVFGGIPAGLDRRATCEYCRVTNYYKELCPQCGGPKPVPRPQPSLHGAQQADHSTSTQRNQNGNEEK